MRQHRDEISTFLYDPRFDTSNWRAEQAIRPAVVNRRVFGGNRTRSGAHALLRRCADSRLSLIGVIATCR